MGSKKVLVSGIGWCYEITADLPKKSKNNVRDNKKIRTLKQNKKSK